MPCVRQHVAHAYWEKSILDTVDVSYLGTSAGKMFSSIHHASVAWHTRLCAQHGDGQPAGLEGRVLVEAEATVSGNSLSRMASGPSGLKSLMSRSYRNGWSNRKRIVIVVVCFIPIRRVVVQ